ELPRAFWFLVISLELGCLSLCQPIYDRFCYFSVERFAIGFHSNLCPFDLVLRFALRVVVLGLFFLSGARFVWLQPVFPPPAGCGFLSVFFRALPFPISSGR
uniref:Uncharacterized protein n=2 Tax=Aegilops tauschii subsp. strangulata TaxID=200361 RepID=A0A453L1A0_AEGTS